MYISYFYHKRILHPTHPLKPKILYIYKMPPAHTIHISFKGNNFSVLNYERPREVHDRQHLATMLLVQRHENEIRAQQQCRRQQQQQQPAAKFKWWRRARALHNLASVHAWIWKSDNERACAAKTTTTVVELSISRQVRRGASVCVLLFAGVIFGQRNVVGCSREG